jgi:hypothetical protein
MRKSHWGALQTPALPFEGCWWMRLWLSFDCKLLNALQNYEDPFARGMSSMNLIVGSLLFPHSGNE